MENQPKNAAPVMCRLGCGFYGTSATEGLCSKCFKDTNINAAVVAPPRSSSPKTLSSTVADIDQVVINDVPSSADVNSELKTACELLTSGSSTSAADTPLSDVVAVVEEAAFPLSSLSSSSRPKAATRCATCKKRVGLTGFSCRCGGLYCSEHRYDDAHDCQFDYKSAEREDLRKKHPLVVSDKIQRI